MLNLNTVISGNAHKKNDFDAGSRGKSPPFIKTGQSRLQGKNGGNSSW